MDDAQSRFAEVWTDADAAEAAALERHKVERSYRRVLAVTDDLLGKLEQRNLGGHQDLDPPVRRDLATMLEELPPDARSRFPAARTVQEALDGVFKVQESLLIVLQRILHWDRLLSSSWLDEMDMEDAGEPAARRSA